MAGELQQIEQPATVIPPELLQGDGFDNEWVKLMNQLSKNESLKDFVSYINSCYWSRRQKVTIIHVCKILLGNRFSTTYIDTEKEMYIMKDYKDLVLCNLPINLTRFDLTPEFSVLISMLEAHFEANLNMSKNGWYVKRVGTHSHDIMHEERLRDRQPGFKEKIESKLFGD